MDAKDVRPEYGWWIWAHNPERYASEMYEKAAQHLVDGAPFQNTNIPPGYVYQPWTMDRIYGMVKAGKALKFEGDWS